MNDEVVWRRRRNWVEHFISPPRRHVDEGPPQKTVPRPLLGIQLLYKHKRATVPTLQSAILLLQVLSNNIIILLPF
jgi:hypothetical protein